MRTRLRGGAAWCAPIVLIALAATGCGGGGNRLSAPGYVREASAICTAANRKVERIEIPSLSKPRSVARAMRRVIEIQRRSIEGLRDLRPPERYGSLNQRWIALLDQSADELDNVRALLVGARPRRAAEYGGKAWTLAERARALVAPHGVTSCAGPVLGPV